MHLQPRGISRVRRAAIFEFLECRNATTEQIARRFFACETPETARKKASRWLCRQRKRRRVHIRGIVCLNRTGRPELVYGQRCNEEQLEHEVWITEAELLLDARCKRSVPVGKTFADALFVRDATRFYIEVDNQTMTAKQMQRKWGLYGREIDGYVLVICHTKERLRRLMRGAEPVKDAALFTRFRWLRSPHVKEQWIDWYGNRANI